MSFRQSAPAPAIDLSSAIGTLSLRPASAEKKTLKGVVSLYDSKKGWLHRHTGRGRGAAAESAAAPHGYASFCSLVGDSTP